MMVDPRKKGGFKGLTSQQMHGTAERKEEKKRFSWEKKGSSSLRGEGFSWDGLELCENP